MTDTPQVETQVTTTQEAESTEQINWKKFRAEKEALRKAKEQEALKAQELANQNAALQQALDAVLTKQQPQQQATHHMPVLPKDQFVTGEEIQSYLDGTLDPKLESKIDQLLDRKERQRQAEAAEREKRELPNRVKTVHSDWESVVSQDNCDYLEYHHPELSASISAMPESVEKYSTIYKAIKRYVPNAGNSQDMRKLEANALKPRSASASGVAQTVPAPSLVIDNDRKKANYERMMRQIKGSY